MSPTISPHRTSCPSREPELSPDQHLRKAIEHAQAPPVGEPDDANSQALVSPSPIQDPRPPTGRQDPRDGWQPEADPGARRLPRRAPMTAEERAVFQPELISSGL